MSQAFDLVVVGRPSVDLIFSGIGQWPALGADIEADGMGWCAGTAFNTPAAANRVGLRVAYVATLGNDQWSQMIRAEFDAEGLLPDFLEVQRHPMPGVSVAFNLDGDRGFVTHWGGADAYDEHLKARATRIVRDVNAQHLHAYVDEHPELEAIAHDRGMTISLDAWGGSSWASTRSLAEVLANADVLFANEPEAAAMSGESNPERALERLANFCACVVVKRGPAGAMAYAAGQMRSVTAAPVTFVDATGAGDCFNAGFLAGWLRGLPLKESLTLGVICGSRAVEEYGGYRGCPREADLREIAALSGITFPSARAGTEGAAR